MEKLLLQIELYIEERFIDPDAPNAIKYSLKVSDPSWIQRQLDKIFSYFKQTFPEYLLAYIAERGFNEVDIYKRAQLDRRVFSKLRKERNYMPSKETVLLIAFAMELNLHDAEDLLEHAGYSLSEHSKKDVIIKFFFERQIYDLFALNEALDRYGFKPLC